MMKALLISSFLLCIASVVCADIYKYTDERGVVCYTDAPQGKKTEKVMKGTPAEEKNSAVSFSSPVEDYSSYVSRAASKYEIVLRNCSVV